MPFRNLNHKNRFSQYSHGRGCEFSLTLGHMANFNLILLCFTLVSSLLGSTNDRTLKRKRSNTVSQNTDREERQCTARARTNGNEHSNGLNNYGSRTTRSSNRTERRNYAEIGHEDEIAVEKKVPEAKKIQEPSKAEIAIKQKRALTVFDLSADQWRSLEAWTVYYNHKNYCDPIHADYLGVLWDKKDEHDPFEKLSERFPENFVCRSHHPEPKDIHLLPDDPWRNACWRQQHLLRSINDRTVEVKAMPSDWLTSELMEDWLNFNPDPEVRTYDNEYK